MEYGLNTGAEEFNSAGYSIGLLIHFNVER